MRIHDFARKRPYMFWYVDDFDTLSKEAIVENTLNYGDFDDFKRLLKILGLKETASIFRKQLRSKRHKYRPIIANYFKLYFNKYA